MCIGHIYMFFLTKGATGGPVATGYSKGTVALGMEARRAETHVVSEAQFTTARPVG